MLEQTQPNFLQDMKKHLKSKIFKPESSKHLAHQMPKQKMEPALKQAVENGQPVRATVIALSQSSIIRGGLVGAMLTAAIGFNAGKYSRLGQARKRLKFLRKFISVERKPPMKTFTNYFYPNIKTVTKNILCFSGQQGIGKSYHFQRMIYIQSMIRPTLYLSFKATGVGSTFQEDIANKFNYGEGENPPMLSQIMLAVRKINFINSHPYLLWAQIFGTHSAFAWAADFIVKSDLLQANQGLFLGMLGTAYVYYFYMIYPWIVQSIRRTKPLIVFDDINKLNHIGLLAQISRFLQLHEQNMGNVILIASDQETWFKLRKEPGLKDRLRQRVITYDNRYTADAMIRFIENELNYKQFLDYYRVSPLFNKQLIVLIIQQLVGNRQVTIRRLRSLLVLNDEQQYQRYVKVLVQNRQGLISNIQAVQKIEQILYQSQMETIVAKLKHIKRQMNITQQNFLKQMQFLLEKGKLPSDNKIAPYLMAYSIVRDTQSEFVFNGEFMYKVFRMAYEEYVRDLAQFYPDFSKFQVHNNFDSNLGSRCEQKKASKQLQPEQAKQVLNKAKIYEKQK